MPRPVIKSFNSYFSYLCLMLLGGGFCLFFAYHAFLISIAPPYWQLTEGIGSIILAVFGLTCLAIILRFDTLYIDGDTLIIKSILGYSKRTIPLNTIIGWAEIEHVNKTKLNRTLTLFTDSGKYQLSTYIYGNYDLLKAMLTHGVKRDKAREKAMQRRGTLVVALCILAMGLFLTGIALATYNGPTPPPPYPMLNLLSGTITNRAEISKGAKGSRSVHIKLLEYPDFDFIITGYMYRAMHVENYVENVQPLDTLELQLGYDEMQMKLTRQKEPDFWAKHFDYFHIPVYGLQDKAYIYLSPTDYTDADNDNTIAVIVFALLGSSIAGIAVYVIVKTL
ncbi:MAG TPA: hypothetical protein VK154_15935 [Chitinophagales bacterium]|nr:hypothetical protein [Chitinophagales bacterium]